ncbi:MAG: biotin transporter BioY [Pseudomonadota bacterium]
MSVLGAVLMTVSSYVSVPMYPVPITAQTLTVLLLGAFAGPRLGVVSVLVWIAIAAAGLPVLSDGAGGLEALSGPTAGYIAGFPIAAYLAGVAERTFPSSSLRLFAAFLVAHLVILGLGWAWLSRIVGPATALEVGVTPFLIGAVIKSALALLAIAIWRYRTGS